MELTVQNVFGLLLRSQLLPPDEARAAFDRWNAEARDRASDTPAFLRFLVTSKTVTEYQANLLAHGYADGFFIQQYRVLDRLGKGRMAGVYKAQHPTGPVVAIKVLPPSRAKDAAYFARFQREARLAVKLNHPNIVRTFHFAEWKQPNKESLHYLVMEHLEGETLEDFIGRRKQLLPTEAIPLVYQTLLGLQHIHSQGLVHRDIKPSNLMVTPAPDGDPARAVVKILDLGLSRAMFDENVPTPSEEAPGLTGEGVLLGTPDYMAPEQARDARSADIRADIYSVGCVLYHLLAGQPPFPDVNIISQMIRHATEEPRALKEFNPAVPDGLQQILNWMMAKDPAKRYPNPERAAQALHIYLGTRHEEFGTTLDDPSMSQYLTWLELDNPDAPPPTTPKKPDPKPAGKPPAIVKVTSPPSKEVKPKGKARPTAPGIMPPQKKEGTDKVTAMPAMPTQPVPALVFPEEKATEPPRDKKKSQGDKAELPAVVAPKAVSKSGTHPVGGYDVDLVALPPPGEDWPLFSLPLQRRDFVMFGIGVATAFVGLGLGWMVSLALRWTKSEPQQEPPPE